MCSIFLVSCDVLLEYTRPNFDGSLRISASASSPEYDGVHLKTQLTVDVADARGPVVDYLPEVDVESSTISGQTFVKKLYSLFSNQILLVKSVCSRTDIRGRAECFLEILPSQNEPQEIRLTVSGIGINFEVPLVVFPAPTISSLSLTQIAFDLSESLMITGTNFRLGMQVSIDDNIS